MNTLPVIDPGFYMAAMPVFLLALGCVVSMLQAVFRAVQGPGAVAVSLLLFPGLALLCLLFHQSTAQSYLGGAWLSDPYSVFAQGLLLVVSLFIVVMSWLTWIRDWFFRGEIACLFQMALLGMLVMVASDDLVSIFVGLELSSIAIYALIGYMVPDRQSQEGAIKYFVLGSFATAVMLFGFGLLYAVTGSMSLSGIFTHLNALPPDQLNFWIRMGAIATLSGFAFKFSLAPFHLWAPDAYECAPTGMTGLMATCVKIMIIVVILRLFAMGMPLLQGQLGTATACLAFLSVFAGNILALVQTSLKRLMAYSSVAHSGYMAIALCSAGPEHAAAQQSVLFYLLTYTVASLVAFGVLMWLEDRDRRNLCLNDLKGLAREHPFMALYLTVALFSMAGMPPTAGFLGKFFVFSAALEKGYIGLTIAGALGSTLALFYYLRIIVFMYMTPAEQRGEEPLKPAPSSGMAIVLALGLSVIILGGTLLPSRVFDALKPLSGSTVQKQDIAGATRP